MRLIIISGLSGSGKSVALHTLEDLGYYCIDNIPTALLPALIEEVSERDENPVTRLAVGVDARNQRQDLAVLPELVSALRQQGESCDLLFLQAENDILIKRYSESRRKHPLAKAGENLIDTINAEQQLLTPVVNAADLVIDTTRTSVYDLRDLIRKRVASRSHDTLSVLVESFGFKHGLPSDADFVFDLRCLPNPYWHAELRPLNGRDPAVKEFLLGQPLFAAMFDDIKNFVNKWIPEYVSFNRNYLTIGLGCTGGQHRSVCMAELIADALQGPNVDIHIRHNEL